MVMCHIHTYIFNSYIMYTAILIPTYITQLDKRKEQKERPNAYVQYELMHNADWSMGRKS